VNLDLEFEVANEFNRNITVEISLLDANDNIAELSDISNSNNISLQFGFNLLFN
jgi:hypothetical protein